MFDFEDIFYPLKVETKIIEAPLSCNYENFLISYFKKFYFPPNPNIDFILQEDQIHLKNDLGLYCLVPFNDFKNFIKSLKFIKPEYRENQWALFFGGILFNQYFQKNLPAYQNILKKTYDYFEENKVKNILDIYSLKEAKSLVDFLVAKINFSNSPHSEECKLTSPSLFNQFRVPIDEIRGTLLRQKQILKGFIFSLEKHLEYREKFFYSDIEKRDVPRKETFFNHIILMVIGFIGCYLGDFLIAYGLRNPAMEHIWLNIIIICSTLILGLAVIGLIIISEDIIKVNKKLSYVDLINVRKLSNYLDDNPYYFSSMKYDKNSIIGIEIMEMISLLKQFTNYYDETLQLIDQLFDEDDLLPPLKLERFPSDLLKNSFFKLNRKPEYTPIFERNNNLIISQGSF